MIKYRRAHPTDVSTCLELERGWKHKAEWSSKNDLQYRQHHAACFFRCATYVASEEDMHHSDNDDHPDDHDPPLTQQTDSGQVHQQSEEQGPSAVDHQSHVSESHNSSSEHNGIKLAQVQHHNDDDDDPCNIIGFICATRCTSLDQIMKFGAYHKQNHQQQQQQPLQQQKQAQSQQNKPQQQDSTERRANEAKDRNSFSRNHDDSAVTNLHDIRGPMLVLHSVVLRGDFRNYENDDEASASTPPHDVAPSLVADMLMEYVGNVRETVRTGEVHPIDRIVRIIPPRWLELYIRCGFTIVKPSDHKFGHYLVECPLAAPVADVALAPLLGDVSIPQNLCAAEPSYPCYIVNAFCCLSASVDVDIDAVASSSYPTAEAGTGNPAAVVMLPASTPPDTSDLVRWCQKVAAQFNLSETAFLIPQSGGAADGLHYTIRYFTPTVEIGLCGHATLASAAVVFQTVQPTQKQGSIDTIVCHARNDVLTLNRAKSVTCAPSPASTVDQDTCEPQPEQDLQQSKCTKISMQFPIKLSVEVASKRDLSQIVKMLRVAFGFAIKPIYVGFNADVGDLLIEITPADFKQIQTVNIAAFLEYDGYSRGVIICCVAPTVTSTQQQNVIVGGIPSSVGGGPNRNNNNSSSSRNGRAHGRGHGHTMTTDDAHSHSVPAEDDEYSDHDRPLSDDELMSGQRLEEARQRAKREKANRACINAAPTVDFWSRFFGPKAGIDEDPVTGSAHCILAPHFVQKLGKPNVIGKQLSKRTGIVECQMRDTSSAAADDACVILSGTAQTVMNGTLSM